jgi:hypothetical protein
MSDKDLFEFPTEEIEATTLDLELVRKNVPSYSSEKLCEMIVCDRYFGCYREIAVMCMEELAKRRLAGDVFNYETYIDNSYNDLPKLNFGVFDIREALQQAIGRKLNK